ncbi:endonuclease/exonuclease/phosphatase family protein [Sphingobacterium chuzhouense]|uniref:Endonuclease/exonuclease/phosphatase family protein n=1 Tax=Sphingobacterium chuzhouense TaxID=1742264 RepID=A0ABR7XW93_9SPHI|nr:endonuclease/exonuclease/phosphatase family protein [Sphingobacterium chuzhouense]MBD1423284.1 endonuclease/exonuclease/phosphatase family protein [Sphingobacterium chuzhouense]
MKFKIIQRKGGYLYVLLCIVLFGIWGCSDRESISPEPNEEPEPIVLPDKLKILSYNILEGMKTDRPNNYDNFVAWMKELDPDIVALQEVNGFRQAALEKLAARWGHPYVITNLKATDNYPVALTSKYPLESRRRVTMHVSHGAIFARLKDTDFNIVNTHFWPQGYWHHVGDGLGNAYRLHEMNLTLDSTFRKFPDEPDWIFVGDLNSRSRHDFLPGETTYDYGVTDQIEEDGFEDAIHYLHGKRSEGVTYDFQYPGSRIDFLFATPGVLQKTIKAHPIYDEFTDKYSDHPPMYMEVSLK